MASSCQGKNAESVEWTAAMDGRLEEVEGLISWHVHVAQAVVVARRSLEAQDVPVAVQIGFGRGEAGEEVLGVRRLLCVRQDPCARPGSMGDAAPELIVAVDNELVSV